MGGCRLDLAVPTKAIGFVAYPVTLRSRGNETSTSTMHRSRENIAGCSGIRRPGNRSVPSSLDTQKIDLSGSTNTLPRRCRMSTLDEITKEKQRISEALARVDMQREKLASQFGELEATERVLARYGKGTQLRQTASARTPVTATKTAAPERRRRLGRRQRGAIPG